MGMLGKRFPEAQFLITGLLGPGSNAHGPNEFLGIHTFSCGTPHFHLHNTYIAYGKKMNGAVAYVLAAHAKQ